MAEIDKPLPNTKTTVEVPGEVEIQEAIKENVEQVETKGGPVEIEMTEEGGAETVSNRNRKGKRSGRRVQQSSEKSLR